MTGAIYAESLFVCLTAPKELFDTYNTLLVLINRAGGLYGRILTEVASTDRTQ